MSDFSRVILPSIAVGAVMALVSLFGAPWLSPVSLVLQP
jgi:hypothetical protein